MKVLKNNFNETATVNMTKSYPRKFVYEQCGSELEYEKSDIRIGAFGCAYLDCPLCHYDNALEDEEYKLTADNVEFPTHFWHTSKETGAVDICDNKYVKEYLYKAIDFFRKNKDEFVRFFECGNLLVTIYKLDGDEECYVVVSNDFMILIFHLKMKIMSKAKFK